MYYSGYHEQKNRGTFDFPIEFYYVDSKHPRYQMPFHWHIDYEFVRVLSGELVFSLDADTIKLTPGDVVLVQDGVLHGGNPKDCVYECVDFDLGRFLHDSPIYTRELDDLQNHRIELNKLFTADTEEAKIIQKLFDNMERAEKGYELIVRGLIYELMGIILRNHQYTVVNEHSKRNLRRVRQLKNVLALIREKYNTPLSLDDLAKACDMTPKYFCRFFSEMTGKTPIDYINYYRIECAAERLLYSQDSVTEVAFGCGFNDLSYFVKIFKRYKGTTPTKYRKQKF